MIEIYAERNTSETRVATKKASYNKHQQIIDLDFIDIDFMRTEFLCVSVLRVASGPGVGLAGCGSALNPPVVCSAGRSWAVVPVLVLLFVAL